MSDGNNLEAVSPADLLHLSHAKLNDESVDFSAYFFKISEKPYVNNFS
jgi:hypothetical protein